MDSVLPLSSSLGWYWLVAPFAVAVFGIILFVRGLGHIAHGRHGRGGAHIIAAGPLAALGLAVGLLALNTQTYVRLTHETPVAEVQVSAADAGAFKVTVKRLDVPDLTTTCNLTGDQWQMSASVQKWKPWANVIGMDSTYKLDQVANKYSTAARGQGNKITACDLSGGAPGVNQYVPPGWLTWLVGQSYTEERHFGSAVYMPLADGADYRVVMTQSGLNAESVNPAATSAVQKGL